MTENYLNDDAAQEQAAAEERHAERSCTDAQHVEDAELDAYFNRIDASRPLPTPVVVKRRVSTQQRITDGVFGQMDALIGALWGGK